jgi:type IV secretory pathway VirB4 component
MPKESQATQKFIDLETVREGTLVLKTGALRKILMVSGVNFDLKSEEEQGLITYAYQSFLNSLDFSVQIFVHSRRLNIEGYLKRLEAREKEEQNELLKAQIAGYREFIASFVSQNPIMAKTFFIVVPFDPIQILGETKGGLLGIFGKKKVSGGNQDKEKEFRHNLLQLSQLMDRVTSGLTGIGLQAVPLDNEAIIELFYNLYNPESVEKKTLEIAKEAAAGKTITDIIAPPAMEVNSNYLKLGNKFVKSIFLFTYPRYLASGWF